MTHFKLGSKLKDETTGFTGIALARADLLSGNTQYALAPEGDGKTMPDFKYVDYHFLTQVDEGLSARATLPDPKLEAAFKLGEEAQDIVTGYKGVLIEKAVHMNGCVFYTLQQKGLNKDGETRSEVFDAKRLKRTGAGISKPAVEAPPKVPADAGAPNHGSVKGPRGGPPRTITSRTFPR